MRLLIEIFILLFAVLIGCTMIIPMEPGVKDLGVKNKLQVEVCLLIPNNTRNYIYKGTPEIDGDKKNAFSFQIALGQAMEDASVKIFSQLFKNVRIIRGTGESRSCALVIRPKVDGMTNRALTDETRPDAIPRVFHSYCKIRSAATVYRGDSTKIWEKMIESSEIKSAPWKGSDSFAAVSQIGGQALSEALVQSLTKVAMEIHEGVRAKKIK
jgi:hypothetical protein